MSEPHTNRVLITGGGGLIGSHLIRSAGQFALGAVILAPPRRELDLTNAGNVTAWFQQERPNAVIHCAAMSRSVTCEANPKLARQVNVEITRRLAELAGDVPFVFLSTDLVFDGQTGAYREDDPVGPLNVYAETKVAAEAVVREHPQHLILRTSLNYGHSDPGHRAFNEEILEAWQQGRKVAFFTDEFRTPIPVTVMARAIWELLQKRATGTLHVAGSERLSRWQIAELLLERFPQYRELAHRGSLQHFDGPKRAPDTSLDCTRAQALLSFPLPGLNDWVRQHEAIPA